MIIGEIALANKLSWGKLSWTAFSGNRSISPDVESASIASCESEFDSFDDGGDDSIMLQIASTKAANDSAEYPAASSADDKSM